MIKGAISGVADIGVVIIGVVIIGVAVIGTIKGFMEAGGKQDDAIKRAVGQAIHSAKELGLECRRNSGWSR